MARFTFSINKAIANVVNPLCVALKRLTQSVTTSFTKKDLILSGDVSGSATILGTGISNNVSIETAIHPNMHSHTKESIPTSVAANPDTIVLRDRNGTIYSNGSTKDNTGYKLQDGTDIGTLFRSPDMSRDPAITVETVVIGTGLAITNAYLGVSDENKITLYITTANF